MYSGPRIACFGGAVSEVVQAGGTILAGCSWATVVAKLLALRRLRSFRGNFAGRHLRNVVDDVSLQAFGITKTITKTLGGLG